MFEIISESYTLAAQSKYKTGDTPPSSLEPSRNGFKSYREEKPLVLVLAMKTEEPCQSCFAGLLAMETSGEDSFERDEDFSALNPALRFGKFF